MDRSSGNSLAVAVELSKPDFSEKELPHMKTLKRILFIALAIGAIILAAVCLDCYANVLGRALASILQQILGWNTGV